MANKGFILNRPLYTDKGKTQVLEEGDPKAAFVIGGKGSTVSDDDVEKYKLDDSHREQEEKKADASQAEPDSEKTVEVEESEEGVDEVAMETESPEEATEDSESVSPKSKPAAKKPAARKK
jgi:hypothetical protein